MTCIKNHKHKMSNMKPIEDVYHNVDEFGPDETNYEPLIESIGLHILIKVDEPYEYGYSICLVEDVNDSNRYGVLMFRFGNSNCSDDLQSCTNYEELSELRQAYADSIHWDNKDKIYKWITEIHDWKGTHLNPTLVHEFIEKVKVFYCRTPKSEEFRQRMEEIFNTYGIETAHVKADELMCELLENLGFKEGIDVFKSNPKWYA